MCYPTSKIERGTWAETLGALPACDGIVRQIPLKWVVTDEPFLQFLRLMP
jgi:hypothetical protein